jgi:tRNA pseudouridine55 synthase
VVSKRKGRPLTGILVVDKPQGQTSNALLQTVKRLFKAAKAGHTGALDPLATGVLPICFGEATKFSQYLLDARKTYEVEGTFGEIRSTGDAEGEILESVAFPEISDQKLRQVLTSFLGEIEQVPPIYSALKVNGKKLYEYARAGKTVEIKARTLSIYKIDLIAFNQAAKTLRLRVECSKGTYIRTLMEDISRALGSGAYVSELRRLESGPYKLSESSTLTELTTLAESQDAFEQLDALLLPMDTALQQFPAAMLNDESVMALAQGKRVIIEDAVADQAVNGDCYRLYRQSTQACIGLGEVTADGHHQLEWKAKRLIADLHLI